MTYTKGVLESTIQAIYDRIKSHMATGERLIDIKEVVIGYRPRETGDMALPRIVIGLVDYSEETSTMAGSAGQKTATLRLEFRLQCEKLMHATDAKFADNALFDGAGKGGLAYFQWLLDCLTLTDADVYKPCFDLPFDMLPDATFNIDETAKSIEFVVQIPFAIRFTQGHLGGTY